ncbi:hypothetical protein ABFS82_04G186300 [Erythranthe guttata]|uniref:HMA domain-containing protein n=1 Tax=Erythranthe guttata TaxID=4155 RepID=A0A022PT31_ERYGU|nr:PREDICTED: uncharacterized protein LOC105949036 [Erythranthe guttata]EYU18926.1 hypothetical protein MIMGU_mgv1a011197mg [Erythranthe guttata]|eukprot:XP_012827758.1 PREDICTED: uncharacterized protein LOC105949036 [Erythranthe guttata]
MKSIELFCASPAATAICSSMDHRAITRPGSKPTHRLGSETPRTSSSSRTTCLSQLPFDPASSKPTRNKQADQISRRKSSADVDDLANPRISSRSYLLSQHDKPFLLDNHQHAVKDSSERSLVVSSHPLIRDDYNNYKRVNSDRYPVFRSLSTRAYQNPVFEPTYSLKGSELIAQPQKNIPPTGRILTDPVVNDLKSSSARTPNRQVVELRVSIHCKGCEGKLRKHISRMEGVTSFSIDLESKKVRVIGDVTPLGVLTSISKVKSAQFWPSPVSSSSSNSSSSPRVSLTR